MTRRWLLRLTDYTIIQLPEELASFVELTTIDIGISKKPKRVMMCLFISIDRVGIIPYINGMIAVRNENGDKQILPVTKPFYLYPNETLKFQGVSLTLERENSSSLGSLSIEDNSITSQSNTSMETSAPKTTRISARSKGPLPSHEITEKSPKSLSSSIRHKKEIPSSIMNHQHEPITSSRKRDYSNIEPLVPFTPIITNPESSNQIKSEPLLDEYGISLENTPPTRTLSIHELEIPGILSSSNNDKEEEEISDHKMIDVVESYGSTNSLRNPEPTIPEKSQTDLIIEQIERIQKCLILLQLQVSHLSNK